MTWHALPEHVVSLTPPTLKGLTPREIEVGGRPAWVLPKDMPTLLSLHAQGAKAPPLVEAYRWPGRFPPRDNQRKTVAFLMKHRYAAVLNGLRCVDSDTEYLSPTGWVKISEYTGGRVAQYHPETGRAEFVEPDEYVKHPCPEMIRIKTRSVDQLLSPGHRVLLHAVGNPDKREVLSVDTLLARHDEWLATGRNKKSRNQIGFSHAAIPTTYTLPDAEGLPLSDDEIRLQVAVMADGHFPNRTNRATVRLYRTRKIERLRSLLSALGIDPHHKVAGAHRTDAGFHIFSFPAPRREKSFGPWWWGASEHQRRVIADEVVHWDGCERRGGAVDFTTLDAPSADFVQHCFASTGRTAGINLDLREYVSSPWGYVVHARAGGKPLGLRSSGAEGRRRVMWREPSTDGFQYCFRVPSTFLLFRRNGRIFASGNTGKTLSALWAADLLMQAGDVRRVLILAKKSTLDDVWARECFMSLPHRSHAVLTGSRQKKRMAARDPRIDIIIVNPESLALLEDNLPGVDLVIADEATAFKNYRAQRTRALTRVTSSTRLWLMTATPAPQNPTDAYALIRLIRRDWRKSFSHFRDMTMLQLNQFTWRPKREAPEVIARELQPSIRFTAEECYDVPEVQVIDRHVEMTPQQEKMAKSFMQEAFADLDGRKITAANAAAAMSKVLQVLAGGVYGQAEDDGTKPAYYVPSDPFFEALVDEVQEAEGPVLVFAPFRISAAVTHMKFLEAGLRSAVIMAGTSSAERSRIFEQVRRGELDAMVAIPQTVMHGLDLSSSNTILWTSPPFSHETYEQANARISGSNQLRKCTILRVWQTPLTRALYKRLDEKKALQDVILGLMEENR